MRNTKDIININNLDNRFNKYIHDNIVLWKEYKTLHNIKKYRFLLLKFKHKYFINPEDNISELLINNKFIGNLTYFKNMILKDLKRIITRGGEYKFVKYDKYSDIIITLNGCSIRLEKILINN